jgi:phasin
MAELDQGKRFADKAAGMARDTMRKGEAAAEQSVHATQESFSLASDSVREFNLKVIEIAQENMQAFFEFAQKAATAREPSALMELFAEHSRKQMEMFSKQTQELTGLGQKLASKSATPLSAGFR